jgi:hypothetical protein
MNANHLLPHLLLIATLSVTAYAQSASDNERKEQAVVVYTRLLKSENAARILVGSISSYTTRSPWNLSTNLGLGQRLLVADLPPALVVSTLESCGDAAAALNTTDEGFSDVVLRMSALRKDSSRNIYVHLAALDRYGLPVYKMLGDATGLTADKIKQLALDNRLRSETAFKLLIEAFEREYSGIAQEVAKKRKRIS